MKVLRPETSSHKEASEMDDVQASIESVQGVERGLRERGQVVAG